MRALAMAIVFSIVSAGCVVDGILHRDAPPCATPAIGALTGPLDAAGRVRTRGDARTPLLVWATNRDAGPVLMFGQVMMGGAFSAYNGTVNGIDSRVAGGSTWFAGTEVVPMGLSGSPSMGASVYAFGPDNRCSTSYATIDVPTSMSEPDAPLPRETIRPGQGVHLRTAGFWTNGTLFYTNMDRVHNDTGIPKHELGAYGGNAELRVYVYDEDREEIPAHWEAAGYFTTIEGFNEALQRIAAGLANITLIPPEKAYTLPGREGHALYGDALVFYIEVNEVVDAPCIQAPVPIPCPLPRLDPPHVTPSHAFPGPDV